MAAALAELGLPTSQETLDAALDCSPILARSEDGLAALSFCLERDLRAAPPPVLDSVLAEVRRRCHPAEPGGEPTLLREGVSCFVVQTNSDAEFMA